MELRRSAGGFAPANPIVDLRVPAAIADGLALPTIGVGVVPATGGQDAVITAGRAFYADVAADTDHVVSPLPQGAQLFWQLRSRRAPEEITMRFALPSGATVREARDELGGFVISRGADELARVGVPATVDADQRPVPTSYRLDGDVLRLRVKHRAADVAYPLLVDPPVTEVWQGETADYSSWSFSRPDSTRFKLARTGYLGTGLYHFSRGTFAYSSTDTASWFFNVRGYGDAYIYRANFNNLYKQSFGSPPIAHEEVRTGIVNNATGAWMGSSPQTVTGNDYSYGSRQSCLRTDCGFGGIRPVPSGSSAPYNRAVFSVHMLTSGDHQDWTAFMGGAEVFQADDVLPAVTGDTIPDTWVRDAPSGFSATVTDTGLGMTRASVALRPRRAWTHTPDQPASEEKTVVASCTDETINGKQGTRSNPCPKDLGVSFQSGDVAEGVNFFDVTGTDVIGSTKTTPLELKVDRTPPTGQIVDLPKGIGSRTTIYGRMSDPLSGPGKWLLQRRNPSSTAWANICESPSPAADGRSSCAWDPTSLPEGTYGLRALMSDRTDPNFGGPNSAYTPEAALRIDRTPPIAPPSPGFLTPDEGSAQASWGTASDPALTDGTSGSGVVRYETRSRVAGGTWKPWRSHSVNTRLSDEDFDNPNGTRIEWEIVAIDAAGNRSAAATTSGVVYGTPPEVSAAGPLSDLDGEFVGSEIISLGVAADDDVTQESQDTGIRRLIVENDDGSAVGGVEVACQPKSRPDGSPDKSTCPMTASGSVMVDTARLPQGEASLTVAATDRAGNKAADTTEDVVNVVVDHAPPSAPTDPALRRYRDDVKEVTLHWIDGDDAQVTPDIPGSVVGSEFRYRRNSGAWTAWRLVEDGEATLTSVTSGTVVDVEIRTLDGATNRSAVTSRTFTVSDSNDTERAAPSLATAEQTISAVTRSGPVGLPGRIDCVPNIKLARSRQIKANPVEFREAKQRLGAVLNIFCDGDIENLQSVEITARFAVADPDQEDGYRAIEQFYGPGLDKENFSATIEDPQEGDNILPGLVRFCGPDMDGARKYLVVGNLKLRINNADDREGPYNTDRDKPVTLACPTKKGRQDRQRDAYRALTRYSINGTKGTSPSRFLRQQLGPQPYAPDGTKRAWDAHHIVPVGKPRSDLRTPVFGQTQAVTFRCRVHPNSDLNGVYLRGQGLRRRLGDGNENPRYQQLVQYDQRNNTEYAKVWHHFSTFSAGYFTELAGRFRPYIESEGFPKTCPDAIGDDVKQVFFEANRDLEDGDFGGEGTGN